MSSEITPFVAVDFDGTLCHDGGHEFTATIHPSFDGDAEITSNPISAMAEQVNIWRAKGFEVRILTARTNFEPVHAWLVKHLGYDLKVTNVKEPGLIALFDDRAIRVSRNTGHLCQCYLHRDDVRHHKPTVYKWIPEAPDYPSVYAWDVPGMPACTMDVYDAIRFDTLEACQLWCDMHPERVFVPKEHAFG